MKRSISCLSTAALLSAAIAVADDRASSGAGTARTMHATAPVPEWVIAYNVLVDPERDDYDVFVMEMDGSSPTNVTRRAGVEWTYLSVGERLYFVSDQGTCRRCYRLWVTNARADDPMLVSGLRLADSWMSARYGGREIIVRPHEGSAFRIINSDAALVRELEIGLPFGADPLFVNGGRQVVFRGGRTASKRVDGFDEELFIVDEDGANLRQLTHYPAGDPSAAPFGYRAGAPRVHPTENFVSYQSKQNGRYSLYAVSLDGSRHWKLTDSERNEGWHDWSPDGKWLAVEVFDDAQTQFHIELVSWETKQRRQLTTDRYRYQQAPSFLLRGAR